MRTEKVVKILLPSERFRKILFYVEITAAALGVNVLDKNYRLNWITYLLIGFIITYFSCTLYTCYLGVVIKNDWPMMLESVCVVGTGIQGLAKLINGLSNGEQFRALRSEIQAIYEKYERKDGEYRKHLTHSLTLLKHFTTVLLLVYGISMLGLMIGPLYRRYMLKEDILLLQFIIPGIDPKTSWGYAVHQTHHFICIFFGFFGNFASDTFCFILVVHIPLIKNILKCKFDELDVILRLNPRDVSKSGERLRDILQWHQKYVEFSVMAKNSFFWVIFVQLGTSTISIICTIICQFLGIMPYGPIYLVFSFVTMYIYSGLGNLVEIANDDVTLAIYDCLWYLLTIPEQKMILLMLRQSQDTEGMSIAGISPLSLNAALQITKTIYTVTMMINNFLK